MNCTECLALLRSADLSTVRDDLALQEHSRTCPACARAREAILTATRQMADTLDAVEPSIAPDIIAGVALHARHEATTYSFVQRLALIGTAGFAAAMCVIAVHDVVPLLRRVALATAQVRVETLTLHCLPSAQAARLARPYLRSFGSYVPAPADSVPALTLVGTPAEIDQVSTMLRRVDPMSCRTPAEQHGERGPTKP